VIVRAAGLEALLKQTDLPIEDSERLITAAALYHGLTLADGSQP
jgi:hypothetical protein